MPNLARTFVVYEIRTTKEEYGMLVNEFYHLDYTMQIVCNSILVRTMLVTYCKILSLLCADYFAFI